MAQTEALRTQLDALRVEAERLKVENARLRDAKQQEAERIDAEATIAEVQAESQRKISSLQEELQTLKSRREAERNEETLASVQEQLREQNDRVRELERECETLRWDAEQQRMRAELDQYRAVEAERRKWEAREEKLEKRVEELQQQLAKPVVGDLEEPSESEMTAMAEGRRPLITESSESYHVNILSPQDSSEVVRGSALLAHQLPPLSKYAGETREEDGETFEDWLEQFELIADLCQWDQSSRLVNLVTRLRGQAYAYYRSVTPQQRTDYGSLVEGLKRRFTPVHLKAVQSSLFHDRKQGSTESVDEYAQSLRSLFHRAYPSIQRGSEEAEALGQTVLTSQFVAGLRPSLKTRIAGIEGEFEELLVKARFEEAKLRDLNTQWTARNTPTPGAGTHVPNARPGYGSGSHSEKVQKTGSETNWNRPKHGAKCYNCGSEEHLCRQCPLKKKGGPTETPGRGQMRVDRRVATLTPDKSTGDSQQETAAELREKLKEAEIREALKMTTARMNGITTASSPDPKLGPTLTANMELEGSSVRALLDTGSPVTIVDLGFLLEALAKKRNKNQKPAEWREAVEERLERPTIALQDYSGGQLNTVSQLKVHIARAGYTTEATIQVQKDAPADLLLGTDLLPQLGFHFIQLQPQGESVNLLTMGMKEQMEIVSLRDNEETVPGKQIQSQEESSSMLVTRQKKQTELETSTSQKESTSKRESDSQHVTTVCLLQATRLPAQHKKLLRARVQGLKERTLMFFQPGSERLQEKELTMDEAVTVPDCDDCITLIIENHGLQPIRLKKGEMLGTLEPVSLGSVPELLTEPEEGVTVSTVLPGDGKTDNEMERKQRLLHVLQVERGNLKAEEYQRLCAFLADHHEQFMLDPMELGCTDQVTHSIDTANHQPIRQHPRRLPFALQHKVEEMVQKMLEQGVIAPSHSPWASPVVLVEKKDGTHRFCVDYRRLNSVTKMDVFPLPRIDDTLDLLAHSHFFSTLDLASGYWQVKMDAASREKTAFTTHEGLYEFLVMPFGLCNAPATFQRLMETVLSGLTRRACVDYIDDILVIGHTFEEHLKHLQKVFDRLKKAGLKLKAEKCRFGASEVTYLGYVVSQDGLAPTPDKVKAVLQYPQPTDLKSLRSFLGLASYYRRFIPRFSVVASPLHALTRKDVPYVWNSVCEEAFSQLKQLLSSAPVLAFPDFTQGFTLETDASGIGLGSVLAQKQEDGTTRPVAYASRTLQAHEKNYGVTELEALALVWSVKHFRHYLYGHHCDVYTDHEALKSLLNTPHPSGKLARWGLALQELDLNIIYRPGKTNANADALSRAPLVDNIVSTGKNEPQTEAVVAATLTLQDSSKSGETHLEIRQRQDPELKQIIDYCQDGVLPQDDRKARELTFSKSQFEVVDRVLYHVEKDKSLRIVPPAADRQSLFHEVHDGRFGAHLRDAKIHGELGKHYILVARNEI